MTAAAKLQKPEAQKVITREEQIKNRLSVHVDLIESATLRDKPLSENARSALVSEIPSFKKTDRSNSLRDFFNKVSPKGNTPERSPSPTPNAGVTKVSAIPERTRSNTQPSSRTPSPMLSRSAPTIQEINLEEREKQLQGLEQQLKVKELELAEKEEKQKQTEEKQRQMKETLQRKWEELDKTLVEKREVLKKLDEKLPEIEEKERRAKIENAKFLYTLCQKGDLKKIEETIKNGIDPNYPFNNGQNILHAAAQVGDLKLVYLLMNNAFKKVNPNLADAQGKIPLHYAIPSYDPILISQLIWDKEKKCVCNVKAKDKYGKTAFDYLDKTHEKYKAIESILLTAEREAEIICSKIRKEIESQFSGLQWRKEVSLQFSSNSGFVSPGAKLTVENLMHNRVTAMKNDIQGTILLPDERKVLEEAIDRAHTAFMKEISEGSDKSSSPTSATPPVKGQESKSTPSNTSPSFLAKSKTKTTFNLKFKSKTVKEIEIVQGECYQRNPTTETKNSPSK